MSENLLNEILARHGVEDAHEFLDRSDNLPIERAPDPDVRMRGSVHQIKGMLSNRKSVQVRLSELKHV